MYAPSFIKNLVISIVIALLAFSQSANAQGGRPRIPYNLTLQAVDSVTGQPLIGATLILKNFRDTTDVKGGLADVNGNITVQSLQGRYNAELRYIGYGSKFFTVGNREGTPELNLGKITLSESRYDLKAVEIKVKAPISIQKGDTTEFNANRYKVNQDANADELVTKMPGITNEGGVIKAQGEEVRQVLLDGKPFMGGDATMALKSLPAEVIDKIQVFDRASEQSQFTGFSDGQEQKSINIITKKEKRNMLIGRVYGGYGNGDLYNAGLNVNKINGDERISVLSMFNNINQQNFSFQDLLGVNGGGGGMGRRMMGMGGRGGQRMMQNALGSAASFLNGQQNGISTTSAIGLNYANTIGKLNISGSYFFNKTSNITDQFQNRNFFLTGDSSQVYAGQNKVESNNFNHRLNARVEYTFDSSNAIVFTPSVNLQSNRSNTTNTGITTQEGVSLNSTNQLNGSNRDGYNISGSLLYRHKFAKKGRTITTNLSGGSNTNDGTTSLIAQNVFGNSVQNINQSGLNNTRGDNYSYSLNYTEPLGEYSRLQFSAGQNYTFNKSERDIRNIDSAGVEVQNLQLSNRFDNRYQTTNAGVDYQYNKDKWNITLGLAYQNAYLEGNQLFPFTLTTTRTFNNIIPNVEINYKVNDNYNARLRYRLSTNAPSISQLQNVIDNSNPLFLTGGNPDLKQEVRHRTIFRIGGMNPSNSSSAFLFAIAEQAQDYIANNTIIATRDTLLTGGIRLAPGAQFSAPINLNGFQSYRSFFTYGYPVGFLKSNVNYNANLSYVRTPGSINNIINISNNYGIGQGAGLSSNISEKIDFNVNYNLTYNIVENRIQPQLNQNYWTHNVSLRGNWIFYKTAFVNPEYTLQAFRGLADGLNQQFALLNLSVGTKIFKDKSGELKFTAFDVLGENNAISRNVTETFVEDTRSNVLTRYYMLTFTWRLRKFSGSGGMPEGMEGGGGRPDFQGRPAGGRP